MPLLDDRGYYSAGLAEMGVKWEPAFDWLLSFSYGLQVERESDPRKQSEVQVGSDIFGFGVKYSVNATVDVEFQSSYALTNTSQNSFMVNGGLIWNL